MSILTYLKGLLPSFRKNAIVESCEMTSTSLREHTLPAYLSAEALFKSGKFKNAIAQDFATVYFKNVGKAGALGMMGSIRERLDNALVILLYISTNAKTLYSDVETNISLTYVKLTCLRLVEAAEFSNTYARKLLNYVFILETAQADASVSVKDSLTPAEIAWLDKGFLDFCLCMNTLGSSVEVIKKHLAEMPDASITSLTEKTFPTTLGVDKIDPFQMRHLSASVNPFYYFGMMIAERQAKRYKAAKAELELLQLRCLNLDKLYNKNPDARLQKEIEYMENRVVGLSYDIVKMEEEYNHG